MKRIYLYLVMVFCFCFVACDNQYNSYGGGSSLSGLFYVGIIVWILTIILTIVLAVKKGYSGFLAFLLGLFIPLLGSTIVIALLPDNNEIDQKISRLRDKIDRNDEVTTKRCKRCKKEFSYGYTACPHCGSNEIERI